MCDSNSGFMTTGDCLSLVDECDK